MALFNESEDHEPLFWWQGRPVYAAYLLVIVYVISMLVTTLFMAFKATHLLGWMIFESTEVLQGKAWQILTYSLYNPPSPWFVVDMFMLGWFGREVERSLGRGDFLKFYLCIYLLSPVVLTLIGWWLPFSLQGVAGTFAIFIAFATLHPEMPLIFGVPAKWMALILVALGTLMAIAYHSYVSLITLWTTSGFAYLYIRHHQGHFSLPSFRIGRRKPKLRVLPDLPPPGRASNTDSSVEEMDALLDKIARSGMTSLTAKEKARLESMRADLLRRRSVEKL
jgi:membrane associated rhomboid family serine protease